MLTGETVEIQRDVRARAEVLIRILDLSVGGPRRRLTALHRFRNISGAALKILVGDAASSRLSLDSVLTSDNPSTAAFVGGEGLIQIVPQGTADATVELQRSIAPNSGPPTWELHRSYTVASTSLSGAKITKVSLEPSVSYRFHRNAGSARVLAVPG